MYHLIIHILGSIAILFLALDFDLLKQNKQEILSEATIKWWYGLLLLSLIGIWLE